MIQAAPSVAPVRRGELYLRISLQMGGYTVGVLSAGYLTDSKTMTWPPGVHETSTEGPGLLRTFTGTNPAAGADIAETVPVNTRWKIIAIRLSLVTDANVAARRARLSVGNGTNDFVYIASGVTQAASLTKQYVFQPGHPNDGVERAGDTIEIYLPPDLILLQAYTLAVDAVNKQAGDDWAAPIIFIEEWIEE